MTIAPADQRQRVGDIPDRDRLRIRIRRIYVVACRLSDESSAKQEDTFEQLDLFTDYAALEQKKQAEKVKKEKERKLQEAVLSVKKKYGKNAMLKGMNLQEGATSVERNRQIGGHKA